AGLVVSFDAMSISLSAVEHLIVAGGEGNDSISLTGTTAPEDVTLLGEGGDDALTLSYPLVTGTLAVDGGTGANDTLLVNLTDEDEDVTLTAASIEIGDATGVGYANF